MRLISAENRSDVPFYESTRSNETWVTEEFPHSIVGFLWHRDITHIESF